MTPNELIIEYDLKSKSRKRELVYMRFVMYKYFRLKGMSLAEIGKLFNRDHATVLHGLKEYETLNESIKHYQDFAIIKELVIEKLGISKNLKYKRIEPNALEERILKCNNYYELMQLKESIKKEMLARENELNDNLKMELI